MLILARYIDEAVLIGSCRVIILGVDRRKHGRPRIKLGIDAPPDVQILRAELSRFSAAEAGGASARQAMPPDDHLLATSADEHEEAEA